MNDILVLENVSQRFDGLHALRDVSLSVQSGEILGLIGPNGAGKSTLFNAIVGLVRPTAGRIYFEGRDLIGRPVHETVSSGVAKTSQKVQIFDEMSVLDNVAVAGLGSRALGEARAAALQELDFWGLAHLRQAQAKDITLAQRSTLELARALMLEPRVLLVDEVMAGLNDVEVEQMLERFAAANEQRDLTLVVIEHNMRAIMQISHRVTVLDYGEVIAVGRPEAVKDDPRVVEAYLGVG